MLISQRARLLLFLQLVFISTATILYREEIYVRIQPLVGGTGDEKQKMYTEVTPLVRFEAERNLPSVHSCNFKKLYKKKCLKRKPEQATLSYPCRTVESKSMKERNTCSVSDTHLRIIDNKISVLTKDCTISSKYLRICELDGFPQVLSPKEARTARFFKFLLSTSQLFQIPDATFCFDDSDVPTISPKVTTLSLSTFQDKNSTWQFPAPWTRELEYIMHENKTMETFDPIFDQLVLVSVPFEQRLDKLLWVGNPKACASIVCPYENGRFEIYKIAKAHPDLIDVNPKDVLNKVQQTRYKYILSLAGAGFTGHLPHSLLTGSVVLIQETKVQMWFEKDLVPWVHFVPVKSDLSNVYERMKWLQSNQEKSSRIANNSREYAKRKFEPKNMMKELVTTIAKFPFMEIMPGNMICPITVDAISAVINPCGTCSKF